MSEQADCGKMAAMCGRSTPLAGNADETSSLYIYIYILYIYISMFTTASEQHGGGSKFPRSDGAHHGGGGGVCCVCPPGDTGAHGQGGHWGEDRLYIRVLILTSSCQSIRVHIRARMCLYQEYTSLLYIRVHQFISEYTSFYIKV